MCRVDRVLRHLSGIVLVLLALLAIPLVWMVMWAIMIEEALRERVEQCREQASGRHP